VRYYKKRAIQIHLPLPLGGLRSAQPQSGEAPSGEHLRGEAGIGVIAGNTV